MILGIDVGGTTIKFGVVDNKGNIVKTERFITKDHCANAENFIELIKSCSEKLVKEYAISGIGIGVPGQLSFDGKTIVNLTNIPTLNGLNVVNPIQKHFPNLKIVLENDARCAAMGEYHFGTHSLSTFLLVALGTGVGGGLIVNGEIFKGAHGNPTEVGMIPVGKGEYLEDYIGNRQIVEFTQNLLKDFPDSILKEEKELTVEKIYTAAKKGDVCSLEVFNHVGKLLGQAIISMVHLYDVHTIIIGGGVGNAFDIIEPIVMDVLKAKLIHYYLDDFKLLPASNHSDTGIIGAASLVK